MAKYKLFNMFSKSSNKDDKGLTKSEAVFNGKYNFTNFFIFFKNNLGVVVKASLIFTLVNIPIFCAFVAISGNFNSTLPTPSNMIYPIVYGVSKYDSGAAVSTLMSVFGTQTTVSVWSLTSKILLACSALVVFTFGFANTGMTYLMRGIVKRQHLYVWSDFFYAIKKNFKQALFMGILDTVVCLLLVYDIFSYNVNRNEYLIQVFFYLTIVLAVFYLVMRFYTYIIMITFDLSIYKIIKNSFIFSILGFKRNICGLVSIAAVMYISFYLFVLLQTIGILLPFFFTIGFIAFIMAYCAYPIVSKYMIDPYYKEEISTDSEQPIFKDRG
ncbi:MAG: DUF624 domain-containing protein [Clostridia bacterium]